MHQSRIYFWNAARIDSCLSRMQSRFHFWNAARIESCLSRIFLESSAVGVCTHDRSQSMCVYVCVCVCVCVHLRARICFLCRSCFVCVDTSGSVGIGNPIVSEFVYTNYIPFQNRNAPCFLIPRYVAESDRYEVSSFFTLLGCPPATSFYARFCTISFLNFFVLFVLSVHFFFVVSVSRPPPPPLRVQTKELPVPLPFRPLHSPLP